jgi:hypothetical protein
VNNNNNDAEAQLLFDAYKAHASAAKEMSATLPLTFFEAVGGTTASCQPDDVALFRKFKARC